MWGIFFGEFQGLSVNDCSAVSCDSGVLTRGSESTSFYSAILVPNFYQKMSFKILLSHANYGWATPRLAGMVGDVGNETVQLIFCQVILSFKMSGACDRWVQRVRKWLSLVRHV